MAALPDLAADARVRIEAELSGAWELPGDHPLGRLQGARLGRYRLILLLGPRNNVGSHYFQGFLADAAGRLCDNRLAFGLHNCGPFPAYNWIELTRWDERPTFAGEPLDLREEGLDAGLFALISPLVPPGGHIMVEYDSPSHELTARILALGYPPAVSPIGCLLFGAGCRSYRDWYIPEGGREGPRKLQGFKPLSDEIAGEKTEELRRQVAAVLEAPERPEHGEAGKIARRLAGRLAAALQPG
jgi:hypothetical protein